MINYRYLIGHCHLPFIILIALMGAQFLLSGCASNKTEELVSEYYRFSYEDEAYRVRTVYQDSDGKTYNELLGPSFKAKDLDQDGVIDDIEIGDSKISDVQMIYEVGLEQLNNENRLKSKERLLSQYVFESSSHTFLLISFKTINDEFFNEFKILNKNALITDSVILKDIDADGELDEVLRGNISIKKAQKQYERVIRKGFEDEELVKVDSMIVVKNDAI